MTSAPTGRRSGGRSARQELRASHAIARQPFLTRTMKPFELVSDEGLSLLEQNADNILEQVGITVRDYPSAIERFRAAGCDVDGDRVRFPDGLARQLVTATAPRVFTQHARNPDNSVQIGGDATVFAPNYGSPFVTDLDRSLAEFERARDIIRTLLDDPKAANEYLSRDRVNEDIEAWRRHLRRGDPSGEPPPHGPPPAPL